MTDDVPLDPELVQRVLRRAGDLERDAEKRTGAGAGSGTMGIDESSLIAAAEEVGLSVEAVRRSIAYERLGPVPDSRRSDRVLGPSLVFADGEVDAPADEALARVDAWLVNGHHLRRDALRGGRGEWSKRSGVVGAAMRTVRGVTGEGKLGDFERVHATARDIGDGASIVRVSVDRSANRRFAGGGGAVVAIGGTAGVAVVAAAAAPMLIVAAPVAIVAGVGVALTGRKRARGAQREIARLLDAVGDGAKPTRLSVDVVRRATGRASTIGTSTKRIAQTLAPPPPPPLPPPPLPTVESLARRVRSGRRAHRSEP